MMTYENALAFIHGAYALGDKQGLRNMHALMAELGDPHRRLQTIHVAGTNGKGSVCAFLQAALRCAGYRVGLYTSPFLQRYNERIRIDGVPISDQDLARTTERLVGCVHALRARGICPTEFEIGTAIAFLYFAEQTCDMVVIEVGLGGRLDPTNVIMPAVTAIAAIGLDHMRVLGDTPEAIAAEKAGIIKKGIPMVVSMQNSASVRAVIEAKCEQEGAPYIEAKQTDAMTLGLLGAYQEYNAGVAGAVLRILSSQGAAQVSQQAIAEGFRRARWPGRTEWVLRTPPLLLDGAHNLQGAQALAGYIRGLPKAYTVLICGILQDKAWAEMGEVFASFADFVITVAVDNPRTLCPGALSDWFTTHGISARAADDLNEAVRIASAQATPDGRVVIAGSLYLIGAARNVLELQDSALLSPA